MVDIRTEHKEDYGQVYDVNFAAFNNQDGEAKLVERIRGSENFIPELSIVAEQNGAIMGHLLMSKAEIVQGEQRHEVLALAPIAVSPQFQKQGIGIQLMQEGLNRCKQLGYFVVVLIGHPSYYPKFGFKPAGKHGITLTQFDVPDEVFMVCELKEGALQHIKGELVYPAVFFE